MNLGVTAYLYRPDGYNSMIVMDPEQVRGADSKDFEEIMLVIPYDQIKTWHKTINQNETEEPEC